MGNQEPRLSTPGKVQLYCRKAKWRGRECYVLGNGLVRLTTLTGGGHIAELRFERASGKPTMSPLWIPPWKTIDSHKYDPKKHSLTYGSTTEGKLLAGITGHNLCLDYFGSASPEEVGLGLSLHGEAPNSNWRAIRHDPVAPIADIKLSVRLPVAGLRFTREISLLRDESVIYFKETVSNERKADHFFHWTQHVTLGPPFINKGDSRIALPGSRCLTFPHGYDEGKALLPSGRPFRWPSAPSLTNRALDLTEPFSRAGRGFVVGVLLDRRRSAGFVAAFNRKERLVMGYCFLRTDFPWVTVWEENLAIQATPWRGRTKALGLEFGTTPLPVARRENFVANGPLFGTPTITFVPARGEKRVRYLCFLAAVPEEFGDIQDIKLGGKEILLIGSGRHNEVRLRASRLAENI
jgi:hypothetical protein